MRSISALQRYVLEAEGKMLLPPSVYVPDGDEYLVGSIAEFYKLQIERNNALFNSTEDNKSVKQIDIKIERQRSNLLSYINNLNTAFEQRQKDLQRAVYDYEAKVKAIPKSQRELLNIRRKLEIYPRVSAKGLIFCRIIAIIHYIFAKPQRV